VEYKEYIYSISGVDLKPYFLWWKYYFACKFRWNPLYSVYQSRTDYSTGRLYRCF